MWATDIEMQKSIVLYSQCDVTTHFTTSWIVLILTPTVIIALLCEISYELCIN